MAMRTPSSTAQYSGGTSVARPAPDYSNETLEQYLQRNNVSIMSPDGFAQAAQDYQNQQAPQISGASGNFQTPGGATQQPSVAQAWSPAQQPAVQPPDWSQGVIDQMVGQTQQAQADPRMDNLYNALLQRSQQSLAVDPNDPAIAAQTNAYRTEQERARRGYLADVAEASGPYANLRGEQRLSAERMGQNVGGFQAELMGRELASRREEIAQALSLQSNLMSVEQQQNLQRELALLDQAIRQQSLQYGANDDMLQWQMALLQNEQFNRDLGLRAEDRSSYYDAVRRGLFRAE